MEEITTKTVSFSPTKGFPPYTCSCGSVLKKENEPYWLVQVQNHPTEVGHLRLASSNPDDVCPQCKTSIPLFCGSEEVAQNVSNLLNERKLTTVEVIRLEGD